ncbi:hypothetical protein LTR08_001516 [Meristemomyces frigidus]|nr:hypothetical protein LTR08_001516 [Meristemomyces frigidus]
MSNSAYLDRTADFRSAYLQRFADFRTRITTLRRQYVILEDTYKALSFQRRRDLTLPHAASRFICAAILQHQASRHEFWFPPVIADVNQGVDCNEICPVWRNWFWELRQAAIELEAWQRDAKALDSSTIEPLLAAAEQKLTDVRSMLDRFAIGKEHVDRSLTSANIIRRWNVMYQSIRHGSNIYEALRIAEQTGMNAPDPVPQYAHAMHWRR